MATRNINIVKTWHYRVRMQILWGVKGTIYGK